MENLENPGRNSLQSWEACIHDVSGIQSMNPAAIYVFSGVLATLMVGLFRLQGTKSMYMIYIDIVGGDLGLYIIISVSCASLT